MKNLKPFDLQEALAGKVVMLRNGNKAYVRHHETELDAEESFKLLGYSADGEHLSWCDGGNYYVSGSTTNLDIVGMYPETRTINGFEVPAPETEPLIDDTRYFVPLVIDMEFYDVWHWTGSDFDKSVLQRGLVFLNEGDAIATAKAMLGIDPRSEDEL